MCIRRMKKISTSIILARRKKASADPTVHLNTRFLRHCPASAAARRRWVVLPGQVFHRTAISMTSCSDNSRIPGVIEGI